MYETDDELIACALNMWANWIETSNVILSAEEVKKRNKEIPTHIKQLSPKQLKLVARIRALAESKKGV